MHKMDKKALVGSPGAAPLLPQKVYEHLEEAIVERTYPPGTHLKEDQIAAELGVSRTPVREAFRMLQRAGWLDVHPHAGAYVRHPSVDQVSNVFELRLCLEEWGIELATARIRESQKIRLRDVVAAGLDAAGRGDLREMGRLNSSFHTQIATATGNQLLVGILENLEKQIRWHFAVVAEEIGDASWHEHQLILDAIEAKDGVRARELIRAHIVQTREVFLRRLFLEGSLTDPTAQPSA